MPRIQAITDETATPQAGEILQTVKQTMGSVPNLIATMANSPAVANAFLGFSQTLASGSLSASLREQIALTVAEANQCHYCLSAHTLLAKGTGLSDQDVVAARNATAAGAKEAAALQFARAVVETNANVDTSEIERLRHVGFSDGEILEIVANVVVNIFTNYINHIADTEIDFPVAPQLAAA